MQNLVWKLILIVMVVAGCLLAIYPPQERIRLGKDLQGGTSLIYHVNIPDDVADRQSVLAQTIEVLKERVNPTGVLDISMQPLGADRIEIVMPLPSDRVLDLRRQYEAALNDLLGAAQVRPTELDEALRANRAVERFGGEPGSERARQIASLQESYNEWQEAQQALAVAEDRGEPAEVIRDLEEALAEAQFVYNQNRSTVRRTNLDQARVIRTLNLPREAPRTDQTGDTPRAQALGGLKSEFPHLAALIDRTVEAFDAYQRQRTTLDDPEDLIRLLRGAGVLEFRIAVRNSDPQGVSPATMREQLREVGPDRTDSAVARWFPINDLKQWYDKPHELQALEADPEGYFAQRDLVAAAHEGRYYLLIYTTPNRGITHDADVRWTVERAGPDVDRLGRPAVSFRLDPTGGSLMHRLTSQNQLQPMAIILDGQVYSAPRINAAIARNGIIEGQFSPAEIEYLSRVLAAGALSARLSENPIAINTIGPSIGYDNLMRGLYACMWSVIVVAGFMMLYYFQAGMIANIALAANAIIIFGVMSMMNAAFTLPGLAGVALTIGMAVDANILIYERIREELAAGEKHLKNAVRQGYAKALSTIMDSNITNLIVCVVLIYTATTEVKGFALTLMIGIAGTLFTALFLTRQIYNVGTYYFGWRHMPMLATTVPVVQRVLSPNINWISLRKLMIPASIVLVLTSFVLIGSRGVELFDTEFRGGLTATMLTARDEHTGERLMLRQVEVQDRIRQIGREAENLPPSERREVLRELRNAAVLTVGETQTRDRTLFASGFQLKMALPAGIPETTSYKDLVLDAIVSEMGPELDVIQPLQFEGADSPRHEQYTFPVTADTLGQVTRRPQLTQNVSAFRGGVAVLVENISPPATADEIAARINRMREQPDFSDTAGRDMEIIGVEPADPASRGSGYRSAVVLVSDPQLDYGRVDFEVWDSRVAAREWALITEGLARPATFEQVSEFSSAVAATLRASAVVAVTLSLLGILVYIWIRFGSLRYSAAAVAALVHDVSIGVGALALSQMIGDTPIGNALLIEAFYIDMGVIAAILTLIGYSLNDTIVVLDRIRENRGKLQIPTAEVVNRSINQTFSRTMLTGVTTIMALLILYIAGGTGIRGFAFVMLIGMIVGTYSSIAVAAPMVYKGSDKDRPGDEEPVRETYEPLPASA